MKNSIEVTANQSARTFTIRKFVDGELHSKYRTTEMSKEEFEECEYSTESDWNEFLKFGSYCKV